MRHENADATISPIVAKWLLDRKLKYERTGPTQVCLEGELNIKFGPLEHPESFTVDIDFVDPLTKEVLVEVWKGRAFANTTIHMQCVSGWFLEVAGEDGKL